jgi:hypothetical protein
MHVAAPVVSVAHRGAPAVPAVVTQFFGKPVLNVAQRDMAREMAAFPWRPMVVLEAAAEADAAAAGFTTTRMADREQVASICEIAARMVATGELASRGQATLATLTGDGEDHRKPRSRGLVLALQAVVNAGIPAFIHDRVEGVHVDGNGTTYTRYAADLIMVWPR